MFNKNITRQTQKQENMVYSKEKKTTETITEKKDLMADIYQTPLKQPS